MAIEWTACPYITINHFDVFIGNFELISHIVPVLTLNKLIQSNNGPVYTKILFVEVRNNYKKLVRNIAAKILL